MRAWIIIGQNFALVAYSSFQTFKVVSFKGDNQVACILYRLQLT